VAREEVSVAKAAKDEGRKKEEERGRREIYAL